MHANKILRNWGMILISVFCLGWTSTMAANFDDGQGQPLGDFIEDFDQDGDGMVSEEEFPGPEDLFTHLDQDDDGFITEDEKPDGPPPNPTETFDQDGDGLLSIDEFPGPEEHFEHMDSNGDGYIDEDEVPRGPQGRGRGPGRRGR